MEPPLSPLLMLLLLLLLLPLPLPVVKAEAEATVAAAAVAATATVEAVPYIYCCQYTRSDMEGIGLLVPNHKSDQNGEQKRFGQGPHIPSSNCCS